ncbi:hypothetical protein [Undibacterium sp. Di24W]|uniref:hypothetical protein n=1 Tax=Undibacterium sp. Di24W TaxID=3413033 RepID=UPI003BF2E262
MSAFNHLVRLQKAREKIASGALRAAYKMLAPLIEKNCADAIYLYSTFSFYRKESSEEFEKRRIRLLEQATNLGYAKAACDLAYCFKYGNSVDQNLEKASLLFKFAAEAGDSHAKLEHGLDLFFWIKWNCSKQNDRVDVGSAS